MSRVVVSNIMSVDGFYEGPGRDVMVLNMDEAFDAYNLERIRTAAAVLLGPVSFEGFSGYWPGIVDAPAEPGNQAVSDVNREISRIYNALPKTVVSDTYRVPRDNRWYAGTTVVSRADAGDWIRRARGEDGGDVLVFGSRTMWNALLRRGLIDEVHLMVSPHPLGAGTPIFDTATRLELLEARRFDGSDNVLLRYAAAAQPA